MVEDFGRVVLEFGLATEHNPKYRRTMEDSHVLIARYGNNANRSYFAVHDGEYGGS